MSSESFAISQAAMQNGLAPEPFMDANEPYFESMKNLRPMQGFGAIQPDTITNVVTLSMSFPFPQYVKENNLELILDAAAAYDSSESQISTYNSESQGSTLAITGSDVWDWAVMKEDVYFLTNTASFLYKLPSNTSNRLCAYNKAIINTVCEKNNVLFLAGMSDASGQAWFTGSRFLDLLAKWKFHRNQYVLADEDLVWGTHWVMYSKPGAVDTPHYLTLCALGMNGTTVFDKMKEQIYKAIVAGDIGFLPMRHTGEILKIKQLGARIIAYGRDGIGAIGETQDGLPAEQSTKKDIGIGARGIVSGTTDQHVFIDSNANLWHFNENATAPEYDGFSEFMPTGGYVGNIEHADWTTTNEPGAIASVETENTILTLDSSYLKEFDFDGNLMRRVLISSIVTNLVHGQLACDGTYVVVGSRNGLGVAVLNYSDFSLVIDSGTNFPTADASSRILVLGGGYLYIGFNRTVYKYTPATLASGGSLTMTSGQIGSADIVAGCWDGTNTVWIGGSEVAAKVSPALALVTSAISIPYNNAEYMAYVSSLDMYLVNGGDDELFSLYNSDLTFARNVVIPFAVGDALGVAALGNRLYLGDDINDYIIMLDYNPVVILYDCLWKEYWISYLEGSYIFTATGKLGGLIDFSPTALFRSRTNQLAGYAYDRNLLAYREVELISKPMSFLERGEKQMMEYLLHGEGMYRKRGRVQYRVDATADYANSPWVPFSPQNVAFPICSFIDGKMHVQARVTDGERARIKSIELRYVATDRRFRRGTKAEINNL